MKTLKFKYPASLTRCTGKEFVFKAAGKSCVVRGGALARSPSITRFLNASRRHKSKPRQLRAADNILNPLCSRANEPSSTESPRFVDDYSAERVGERAAGGGGGGGGGKKEQERPEGEQATRTWHDSNLEPGKHLINSYFEPER